MIIQIRPVSLVQRDVFLPSVYHVILEINVYHVILEMEELFTIFLPSVYHVINDGYLFALIHLIPANYRSTLHSFLFAPVFLFIKS